MRRERYLVASGLSLALLALDGCTLGNTAPNAVPTVPPSLTPELNPVNLEPRVITATFLPPTETPTPTSSPTQTPTSTETPTNTPTETPSPTVISPEVVVDITPTQSAAICSAETNDIPGVGQTVEYNGVNFTIKGVYKVSGSSVSNGCSGEVQVLLDLCPCSVEQKTPQTITPTLPFVYVTQTPTPGETTPPNTPVKPTEPEKGPNPKNGGNRGHGDTGNPGTGKNEH